jgi:hypothetical protein
MATKRPDNVCPRCGKQRVVTKTYKEVVGVSVVTYAEMSCPDPKCQALVEKGLLAEDIKRKAMKKEHDRREAEKKVRMAEKAEEKAKNRKN